MDPSHGIDLFFETVKVDTDGLQPQWNYWWRTPSVGHQISSRLHSFMLTTVVALYNDVVRAFVGGQTENLGNNLATKRCQL